MDGNFKRKPVHSLHSILILPLMQQTYGGTSHGIKLEEQYLVWLDNFICTKLDKSQLFDALPSWDAASSLSTENKGDPRDANNFIMDTDCKAIADVFPS